MTPGPTLAGDKSLLILVMALSVLGLVLLSSASIVESQKEAQETYFYFRHQLLYGFGIGVIAMLAFAKFPYRLLEKLSLPIFVAGLVLMGLVFVPGVGEEIGGASRWITIGGITFQATEFAKLSYIVYLSAWLSKKADKIGSLSEGLVPFIVLNAVFGLSLLLQPDLGSLFMVYFIGGVMFFVAGAQVKHMLLMFGMGIVGFLGAIALAPYRLSRVITFLDPSRDPLGIGYQINQSLISIGSGGWFGLGFGQSRQKHAFLPEPMTDSILAIGAEELGFVGMLILLSLFVALMIKGFSVARNSQDHFARIAAVGIVVWITGQAIMNAAAISGLIPLTGIPLPFISYGSSSLLSLFVAVGILLNISKHIHIKPHGKRH